MLPMNGADDDDPELNAKLLAELEQLARGGQAREMAGRLGRLPAPDAGPPPEPGAEPGAELSAEEGEEAGEAPEQEGAEPIPGVEPEEGTGAGPSASGDAGGGLSKDKLRALLAAMRGQA